ncbi:MAG: AraC family transcriptional regulator [Bacteroidota bacterium]
MNYQYSNSLEKSDLLLTTLEIAKEQGLLSGKDFFKIIWAKDGDISFGIDHYRIHIEKNSVFFCTPLNEIMLNENIEGAVVYLFNREFYCIRDHDSEVSCNGFLFLGSSLPIIIDLNEKEQKSFALLHSFFVEEFKNTDNIQGEMLLVLLKRLIITSVRIARKTLPEADMPQSKLDMIRKFNLLVEAHFREKHKVSDYAEMLHISAKSLSNLFLKYYSKSPLKVIGERICLEGQRLLRFSDQNMNEISDTLGFLEPSHFSKFFKKHTGLSPIAYRRKNKM